MENLTVRTLRITARSQNGIITQAMQFWGEHTGTGGSFEIGLENGDLWAEELLQDLIQNRIATIATWRGGVAFGGSSIQL